jgi:hypothetical protein
MQIRGAKAVVELQHAHGHHRCDGLGPDAIMVHKYATRRTESPEARGEVSHPCLNLLQDAERQHLGHILGGRW